MNIIRTAFRTIILALAFSAAHSVALAQTDATLEPAAYAQFGLPPADRVWEPADFAAAGVSIARVPPTQLPRWQGSRSSPLFARMVDPASVEPCRRLSAAAVDRLTSCIQVLEGFNGLVGRYVQVAQLDPSYMQETAPMLGMMLRIAAAMKPASLDFAATLDRNDPTYATRMQGLAQMNSGMLMIVQGSLMTLIEERANYSDAGRTVVARALAETYPVLADSFPANEQAAIEQRLRQAATTDPDANVRAALARWAS